ncbi:MAG: FKBP-type peptidyl-prolyl cis-trans isomerase [Bacteroidales bacterium]|nr:FKBP-type peptidyl-prolyl cis-trans isomerase [Bacteroidales bacterium]
MMKNKMYPRFLKFLPMIALLLISCKALKQPEAEVPAKVEEKIVESAYVEYTTEELKRNTMASGLQYAVIEPGDGIRLRPEMRVSIHYSGFLEEDLSLFDSSWERREPISFVLGRGMVIPGWEEALSYLRVGDIARIWIPYALAYGEQGRGPIPPKSNLIFDIEVVEANMVELPEPFVIEEQDTIFTETGLQIIIVEEGTGELPVQGSVLIVHYTGYLSNGVLFDSSVQRETPFRFMLGTGQVLRGWDEGFTMLRKGSRARLIIPPHLAYGERGTGPIPPGETLLFDVELLDIQY